MQKAYSSAQAIRDNISKRIDALGRSMAELSELTGKNRNYYGLIVRGRTMIQSTNTLTLDRIAEDLGVPPWVLIRPRADVSLDSYPCPLALID